MTAYSSMHEFIAWTKRRLDEMDAGLVVMEREVGAAAGTAREAAAKARTEARAWRENFAKQAQEAKVQGEARLRDTAQNLEQAWTNFESEMSKWADSSQHTGEAYSARAAALLASWQQSASQFKTAAAKLADAESKRVAAAVSQLEQDAAQFRETCAKLQKAGTASWTAVGQALQESRTAFEAAARQVQAQFKNARENPQKPS